MPKSKVVEIKAPSMEIAEFILIGDAPYVQNQFSAKARAIMKEKQEAGQKAKKGQAREAKNFKQQYEDSMHTSDSGWPGIPATGFRAALVSACRLVNFTMTRAKLSLFVLADGFDKVDQTPLVQITKGKPQYVEHSVRLADGTADIRARAMWRAGWECKLRVNYDTDQFSLSDVAKLVMRVGIQIGVGEGRPDSKKSVGMGWGTFKVKGKK